MEMVLNILSNVPIKPTRTVRSYKLQRFQLQVQETSCSSNTVHYCNPTTNPIYTKNNSNEITQLTMRI